MNRWECEEPGCENVADGDGGAVGLVAIGWFFRSGLGKDFKLLCPRHNPERNEGVLRFIQRAMIALDKFLRA